MRLIPAAAIAAVSAAAFTGTLLITHTVTGPASAGHDTPPMSAARTAFPGLTAAATDPQLPSLHTARPAAGKAVQAPGPFDDRFTMTGLTFNGTAVTGTVSITSDVSDILEFEALAGFYDADGHLLGTFSFIHHQTEADTAHNHVGPPTEVEKFSIAVPGALRGKALAAAVGVPVLVNE